MRSFVRHGLVIGTCLGALVASAGCEQKKATEYVTGVSTQVTVPRDLKSVRIQISTGGFVQFCNSYKVYDGKVLLPRSLGNFPKTQDALDHSGPVTFSIVGITEDYQPGSSNPVMADCTTSAQVSANNVRILRRSTQPYIQDRILFLPMPLKYACFDKQCAENETCKGGICVSDTLHAEDAAKLPDYTDGMGDGLDGACFNNTVCMGAALPAAPINPDTCDFAVPDSKDAPVLAPDKDPFRPQCASDAEPKCTGRGCANGQCNLLPPNFPQTWTGVNVEVGYDGGHTKEVLDLDPVEGFSIPDPAKPQIFRLAPGLCSMLKGVDSDGKPTTHRITSVRASGTCAPKAPTQSICYEDQLKLMGADASGNATDVDAVSCKTSLLTPSKSALVLVVDDMQEHQAFFGKDVLDQLQAPLQDPAFVRTDIGYILSDAAAACGDTTPVDIKPATSPEGVTKIVNDFRAATTHPAGTPNMEASILRAYNFLGSLDDSYARRAVVVLGNNQASLTTDTCTTGKSPAQNAADQLAKTSRPISTFATKTVNDGDAEAAHAIADVGTPHTPDGLIPYDYNATTPEKKKQALQAVINYLATCLYDVEGTAPTADSTLSYSNPLLATEVKIDHVDSCPADPNAVGGWTVDNSDPARPRVKVCGKACSDYQKVLSDTSTFTILYDQPSIAVPLYVSNKACFSK